MESTADTHPSSGDPLVWPGPIFRLGSESSYTVVLSEAAVSHFFSAAATEEVVSGKRSPLLRSMEAEGAASRAELERNYVSAIVSYAEAIDIREELNEDVKGVYCRMVRRALYFVLLSMRSNLPDQTKDLLDLVLRYTHHSTHRRWREPLRLQLRAASLNLFAVHSFSVGRLELAEKFVSRAVNIESKLQRVNNSAGTMLLLGTIFCHQGDWARAVKPLKRASVEFEQQIGMPRMPDAPVHLIVALTNLATALLNAISSTSPKHSSSVKSRAHTAIINAGDFARKHLDPGLDLYHVVLNRADKVILSSSHRRKKRLQSSRPLRHMSFAQRTPNSPEVLERRIRLLEMELAEEKERRILAEDRLKSISPKSKSRSGGLRAKTARERPSRRPKTSRSRAGRSQKAPRRPKTAVGRQRPLYFEPDSEFPELKRCKPRTHDSSAIRSVVPAVDVVDRPSALVESRNENKSEVQPQPEPCIVETKSSQVACPTFGLSEAESGSSQVDIGAGTRLEEHGRDTQSDSKLGDIDDFASAPDYDTEGYVGTPRIEQKSVTETQSASDLGDIPLVVGVVDSVRKVVAGSDHPVVETCHIDVRMESNNAHETEGLSSSSSIRDPSLMTPSIVSSRQKVSSTSPSDREREPQLDLATSTDIDASQVDQLDSTLSKSKFEGENVTEFQPKSDEPETDDHPETQLVSSEDDAEIMPGSGASSGLETTIKSTPQSDSQSQCGDDVDPSVAIETFESSPMEALLSSSNLDSDTTHEFGIEEEPSPGSGTDFPSELEGSIPLVMRSADTVELRSDHIRSEIHHSVPPPIPKPQSCSESESDSHADIVSDQQSVSQGNENVVSDPELVVDIEFEIPDVGELSSPSIETSKILDASPSPLTEVQEVVTDTPSSFLQSSGVVEDFASSEIETSEIIEDLPSTSIETSEIVEVNDETVEITIIPDAVTSYQIESESDPDHSHSSELKMGSLGSIAPHSEPLELDATSFVVIPDQQSSDDEVEVVLPKLDAKSLDTAHNSSDSDSQLSPMLGVFSAASATSPVPMSPFLTAASSTVFSDMDMGSERPSSEAQQPIPEGTELPSTDDVLTHHHPLHETVPYLVETTDDDVPKPIRAPPDEPAVVTTEIERSISDFIHDVYEDVAQEVADLGEQDAPQVEEGIVEQIPSHSGSSDSEEFETLSESEDPSDQFILESSPSKPDLKSLDSPDAAVAEPESSSALIANSDEAESIPPSPRQAFARLEDDIQPSPLGPAGGVSDVESAEEIIVNSVPTSAPKSVSPIPEEQQSSSVSSLGSQLEGSEVSNSDGDITSGEYDYEYEYEYDEESEAATPRGSDGDDVDMPIKRSPSLRRVRSRKSVKRSPSKGEIEPSPLSKSALPPTAPSDVVELGDSTVPVVPKRRRTSLVANASPLRISDSSDSDSTVVNDALDEVLEEPPKLPSKRRTSVVAANSPILISDSDSSDSSSDSSEDVPVATAGSIPLHSIFTHEHDSLHETESAFMSVSEDEAESPIVRRTTSGSVVIDGLGAPAVTKATLTGSEAPPLLTPRNRHRLSESDTSLAGSPASAARLEDSKRTPSKKSSLAFHSVSQELSMVEEIDPEVKSTVQSQTQHLMAAYAASPVVLDDDSDSDDDFDIPGI